MHKILSVSLWHTQGRTSVSVPRMGYLVKPSLSLAQEHLCFVAIVIFLCSGCKIRKWAFIFTGEMGIIYYKFIDIKDFCSLSF